MVSFVCDNCGNGYRKNQVESHMYQCGSSSISCVDCSQSFRNGEFKAHIRCITESQKYESKSTYVEKANKGDVKQNVWFENVLSAVENFRGSSRAKDLLEKLTDFPNIPRKKAKFFNFMHNSFRSYGVHDGLLGEIWTVIESFDKKPAAVVPVIAKPVEVKVEAPKRKADEEAPNEPDAKKQAAEVKKFDMIESSKLVCSQREDNEITFKKLFKKILKEYKKTDEALDSEHDTAELKQKLIKKLRKKSSMFDLSNSDDLDTTTVKYIIT